MKQTAIKLTPPPATLKVADFDFNLPAELIAAAPATPREAARLFTWPAAAPATFADLSDFLRPGDLLVFNNSRVIPARIMAHRPKLEGEGAVEIELLFHRPLGEITRWEAFCRPAKRLKPGQRVTLAGGAAAEVLSREADTAHLCLHLPEDEVFAYFEAYGAMPLPPYIPRPRGTTEADKTDYQTVYAKHNGSVAAPTAGLHFSEELLAALEEKGIQTAFVTLHVGAGTFQPVRVEEIADHKMHSEWGDVSPETVEKINRTREAGGRVVAVGTTSLRLLESAAREGELRPFAGETDIFITPGFDFRVVEGLITNFHLPRSTLLMLVAAFMGLEESRALYAHAIAEKARFYSYGDGCLLWRKTGA